MRRIGLLCAALVVIAASVRADAMQARKTKLYRVSVFQVVISPARNKASFWDAIPGHQPDKKTFAKATNSKKLVDGIARLAASVAGKSGDPYSIAAAMAAKAALHFGSDWSLKLVQPDPHGSLMVDGKTAVSLSKIDDTLSPSWPQSWSAELPLSPTSVIQLQLWDKDDVRKGELIGSCSWTNLRLPKKTVALPATQCTRPQLIHAVLLVQPAGGVVPGLRVRPGRYRLSHAEIEVAPSKKHGERWDIAGDPPDPRIVIHVNNREWYTCPKVKDQLKVACNPNKELPVGRRTTIRFVVSDIDAVDHDPIGTAVAWGLVGRAVVGRDFEMDTSGQLNKASITLQPVK